MLAERASYSGEPRRSLLSVVLSLVAVSFEVQDPGPVAAFWAGLLGRDVVMEEASALVPGNDTQVGLRFVAAEVDESNLSNRVHLHLTSTDLDDQHRTVTKAMELGGRIVQEYPEEGHVVMSDPGRNEFCVIEPDNGYLAGTGYLGEVTCEGPPESGRFWQEALGWPLVWDRGVQTAIQSPDGGTKISWDVRPGPPDYGSRRQWLDLTASDLDSELDRLAGLGAEELGETNGVVRLADPGGNEFTLGPG